MSKSAVSLLRLEPCLNLLRVFLVVFKRIGGDYQADRFTLPPGETVGVAEILFWHRFQQVEQVLVRAAVIVPRLLQTGIARTQEVTLVEIVHLLPCYARLRAFRYFSAQRDFEPASAAPLPCCDVGENVFDRAPALEG